MDPFTPIAATINSSLRIFEAHYQLKAVGEQTADLLETTRHVETNLNEARRQRRVKESWLSNNECNWIDGVIDDTEKALRGVARLIEPARVDKATKEGINLSHRLLWVFRDNPQVRDKHARLSVCHQSLTAVIASMYSKDVVTAPVPDKKKQALPPPYDAQLEDLFNWHKRRHRRTKSSMSLQSLAAESPISKRSTPYSTIVASPTWSVSIQGDESKRGPPLDDSQSAFTIQKGPHPPYTAPSETADLRPMLLDAAPSGRAPTAGWASLPNLPKGDKRTSISVDGATLDKPVTRLRREDILRQRQADEQATNSRLPYPMSPSDYETVSALYSETRTSVLTTETPSFSSLGLPQLNERLPRFREMDRYSSSNAASFVRTVETGAPQSESLQPAVEVSSSISKPFSDPRLDGVNGLQLLTEQTQAVDEEYWLPPFSFSSFAPLGSSDSDSQQEHPSCDSHQDHTDPASEGLQLVADLEVPSEEASYQGHGPTVGLDGFEQGSWRLPPLSPGRGRRGGRSWLMFHASRSDLRHSTG